MDDNTFNPNWCSAPGDTISDMLYERGLSIPQLAVALDLSLFVTNYLLDGYLEIDDALAQKLGEYFGNSTQFWINREKHYRERLNKGLKRI